MHFEHTTHLAVAIPLIIVLPVVVGTGLVILICYCCRKKNDGFQPV